MINAGFNPDLFEKLSVLEADNFWFRGRNKLILWAIKKYANNPESFLEIGCGTGFVTGAVANCFPETRVVGSEYFEEGLVFAKKRVPRAEFIKLDARSLPYRDEFSVIGLFDVLEHIKEDTDVLRQIYLALKPGGYLLITVPQHQWLWSSFDVFSCHERRYSAKDLHKKIKHAGFEIIRSSSFVSGLLPVMYIDRISKKKMEYNLFSGLELNVFMNNFFSFFLSLDILLIRFGINLPLGGSRFVVAKKTI